MEKEQWRVSSLLLQRGLQSKGRDPSRHMSSLLPVWFSSQPKDLIQCTRLGKMANARTNPHTCNQHSTSCWIFFISSLQNNALASLDMTYSSLISYSALNRKTLQQWQAKLQQCRVKMQTVSQLWFYSCGLYFDLQPFIFYFWDFHCITISVWSKCQPLARSLALSLNGKKA